MDKSNYKKDIKATLINQVFRVLAGPILLFFIPLYLTPSEQGYWYTFTSIAALAVFADLGFSNIVLQFSAHEFAFLKFNENRRITGVQENLLRLASFFRFSIKWLSKIVCIVFPIIIIGGYLFLNTKNEIINWELAWLIYSLSSLGIFINSILLSFFEGCNSVNIIQKIRFKMALANSIITLTCLYFKLGLFALAFSLLISFFVGTIFIYKNFKYSIIQLLSTKSKEKYNWKKEFLPLIWRYAISWCSGYFIFQMFTPIAFKFYGPEFSGKIGISIAMWTAGFGIAMSWITAVTPQLNILIEKRAWTQLDVLFKRALSKSLLTMIIGGGLFLILDFTFLDKLTLFKRILPLKDMVILFICWIGQVYINALAVYLRGHKKEPLMLISVIVAFYVGISTYIIALSLPSRYLMLGFLSSLIFWIPVVHSIFLKEKRNHEKVLEVYDEQ